MQDRYREIYEEQAMEGGYVVGGYVVGGAKDHFYNEDGTTRKGVKIMNIDGKEVATKLICPKNRRIRVTEDNYYEVSRKKKPGERKKSLWNTYLLDQAQKRGYGKNFSALLQSDEKEEVKQGYYKFLDINMPEEIDKKITNLNKALKKQASDGIELTDTQESFRTWLLNNPRFVKKGTRGGPPSSASSTSSTSSTPKPEVKKKI